MHVLQLSIIPGVELLSYWVCVCVALLLPASQMVVPVGFYQCRKKLRIVLYLSSHPPPCFYQRKQRGVVACSKSERSDHLNLHLITFPVASKTLPFDRCAGKGCSLLITSNFPSTHSYAFIIFHMVPGWNSRCWSTTVVMFSLYFGDDLGKHESLPLPWWISPVTMCFSFCTNDVGSREKWVSN